MISFTVIQYGYSMEKTERVGFEPTVPGGTTVFETVRFNHSRTSPATSVRQPDRPLRVSP